MIASAFGRCAWRFALGLALAGAPAIAPVPGVLPGLATAASAFGLADLQRLLATSTRQEARFHEIRESPWLAAPTESRGVLVAHPDGILEKRVAAPRPETWRLHPDRLERIGPDGEPAGSMSYDRFPALGAMARAMRASLAGRFEETRRDFELRLRGSAEDWTLVLQPRDSAASRHIDRVELQGNADGLRTLVVLEHDGARTSTHLLD